jgi:hypothetical protein
MLGCTAMIGTLGAWVAWFAATIYVGSNINPFLGAAMAAFAFWGIGKFNPVRWAATREVNSEHPEWEGPL